MHYSTVIRGYIKTNFNILNNTYKSYGCGSITDGCYKLQIQIMEYEQYSYFEKGEYIEVKGYVKIISYYQILISKILYIIAN